MGFRVAVVGATGNVGREILTTLAERNFPADDVVALASSRSVGREVSFGEDDVLKVQAPRHLRLHAASTSCCRRPAAKVSAVVCAARGKGRARSSSTTPRTSAWSRTCRWSCPRSTRRRSPATRSAASSPTRTARRSRWSSR